MQTGQSRITHLEQFIADIVICSLLEGGDHGQGEHLVSGGWGPCRWVHGHKHILQKRKGYEIEKTQDGCTINLKKTKKTKEKMRRCRTFAAGRAHYLDEGAQVVLQALLVTFGDYVYDHPESTQQGLAHVLATNGTRQRHIKCKRPSNRRQLTAMS